MKIFTKKRFTDGKREIYAFGINIFNYHKRLSLFEKLYAKRFDGLTDSELEYVVKKQFKNWFGYEPDLNNPLTFNEKLAWIKLYYRNPLMTICADKVKAREYFIKTVNADKSKLVKQLGVYKNIDEIDFDKLPNEFVLKSNWGSGLQKIVRNKKDLDISMTKQELCNWLDKKSNHYYFCFETGYKDIEPRIVCEEFLNFEYKLEFFCFNGKPRFFWIVIGDKTKDVHANFYDLNWNRLPIENHYPNFNKHISKPKCYDEILAMAEKLSGDFPFVRCDFYITNDDFRFSEMTFFHWGGSQNFTPQEYNRVVGDMIKLPNI